MQAERFGGCGPGVDFCWANYSDQKKQYEQSPQIGVVSFKGIPPNMFFIQI